MTFKEIPTFSNYVKASSEESYRREVEESNKLLSFIAEELERNLGNPSTVGEIGFKLPFTYPKVALKDFDRASAILAERGYTLCTLEGVENYCLLKFKKSLYELHHGSTRQYWGGLSLYGQATPSVSGTVSWGDCRGV